MVTSMVYAQDTSFTVTDNGHVGIGTTSPDERLTLPYNQYVGWEYSAVNSTVSHKIGKSSNGAGPLEFRTAHNPGPTGRLFSFFSGASEHLSILYNGNVGIGTTSPLSRLHVEGPNQTFGNFQNVFVRSSSTSAVDRGGGIGFGGRFNAAGGTTAFAAIAGRKENATDGDASGYLGFATNDGQGAIVEKARITGAGNVGIGTTTPGYPLEMASGAHVTIGGVWTDASSRHSKENISSLTPEEAIAAVERLNPVKFNYKAEKDEEYVGFIAEDVPELVASKSRQGLSPMDVVAVLTKVVQQQQKRIAELEARIDAGR
jgi:hypothetical protein